MTADIIIEDARWETVGLEALAARALEATLAHVQLAPEAWDVTVLACNDERIAALNAEFRGKPQSTNVLSWPSQDRSAAAEEEQA